MARISVDDVKAWVESTKLDPQALDLDHLDQLETEVLSRINSVYNTSSWVDKSTTPRLIQTIIAKMYTGWLYDKYYSENQSAPNQYSQLVKQNAEMLIEGILDGTVEIPGLPPDNPVTATFYPNDISSSIAPDDGSYQPNNGLLSPISGDTSTGPAKFSMGKRF
jgi:hypothetical protein